MHVSNDQDQGGDPGGRAISKKIRKILGIAAGLAVGAVLTAAAVYVIRYYPRHVATFEINAADLPDKVLIATQGSAYKNALVGEVCAALAERPAYVKVVDVGELKDVDPRAWQAVVVVNTVMMNRMNAGVRRFLDRGEGLDDVLLLVTAGGGDFKPSGLPVDAVSGASRRGDEAPLAGLVVDWLDQRTAPEWRPADRVLAMEYLIRCDVAAGCAAIGADPERYLELYPDLESRLNRIGYDQMARGPLSAALAAFRLNCELFPESWNAWDSCAEALLRGGEREAALASYRKSLELNPASASGRRALAELGEAS